jgi:hypothetical protein
VMPGSANFKAGGLLFIDGPLPVQDHIEVEAGSLDRTAEFGGEPSPDRVGAGGQQFRLLVDRVPQLIATDRLGGKPGPVRVAPRAAARALTGD